jgi:UDP-N-acetylmuramate--alanine ligase
LELDMDFQAVRRGIEAFEGVDRRMHEITEAAGRLVVDDYAHHPTEVRASLEAARGCWPDRRILAVFQPHLYSRTRQLIDDFGTCFDAADVLVCMDIYPAREAPEPGVTGALVADAARASGHSAVTYEPDKSLLVDRVIGMSRPGDVIMTLGAGDIWRLNREMARAVEALETEAEVHHGR